MTRGLPAEAIQRAVTAMRQGALIILVDDEDRENEADLVLAAEFATTERMAFLVAHTTGIVCVPLTAERADRLALPQMVEHNTDAHGTAFTVSADHRSTGTGVSAADRASTARALADLDTAVTDLRLPGISFRSGPATAAS